MKAKYVLLSAIVISLFLLQLTFAALPRYEIIDLGTLGGYSSWAYAINDAGQVVGMVHTMDHKIRAFLWDSNTGMIDLGTIGNLASNACGINANEQVVGVLSIPGGQPRAFIWDSATGMVELGAGAASSINNAGQIAGEFLTVYDPAIHFFRSHACIWDSANEMIDLGTLGSPCPNSTCPDYSHALSINDAGQVVGYSSTTSGEVHAFLWDSISGMRDLGTLGGTRSWASAINNDGHIVGNSYSVDDKYSSMHAFIWDSSNGMRDLGTLGGNISEACAINDHNQVVGHSYTIDNDYDSIRAFVWDSNNGMFPLDELLPADCVWIELRPQGINNRGQIVGYGINETLQRLSAFLMTPIPPKVIYVDDDASGANDGSSWADAYNYLQDALAAAWSGDEIRVAQGIYTPDSNSADPNGSGDRTATFQLINGVTIKGGYAGFGHPDPNTRDIELYETILSGDLNRDDLPNFTFDGDNSYHVISSNGTDETAVLDGFTITAGNANRSNPYNSGGGMYNNNSSTTLTNCTFAGNRAKHGGGMYNLESSPVVTNCMFSHNMGYQMGGGGMYNENSSPILSSCTFCENSANSGGGMYNENSIPILTNCTFSGNRVKAVGIPYISDGSGGGMCNRLSFPSMSNCEFLNNSAGIKGGGIQNLYSHILQMVNCKFTGNWTEGNGGAIYIEGGSASLDNCTLSGNLADQEGGGIVLSATSVGLENCILWGNSDSGGMDESAQIHLLPVHLEAYVLVLHYICVQGWTGDLGGIGIISNNPCFVDPGYWDIGGVWIDGDYHLLPESPCIDAGDPNYVPEPNETDLDGRPRVINGRIDMGAYEAPIFAEARILPRTINLASKGKWITAYIWLPEDYNVDDIDPNSVFLDEELQPEPFSVNEQQQVAIAKFIREDVQPILDVGDIELTITGRLTDGTIFEGTDVITVIDKAGKKSAK